MIKIINYFLQSIFVYIFFFIGKILGINISRKLFSFLFVYIGPFFGGAIEGWAPYVLAVFFLLKRPEGLFGEKIIRRV